MVCAGGLFQCSAVRLTCPTHGIEIILHSLLSNHKPYSDGLLQVQWYQVGTYPLVLTPLIPHEVLINEVMMLMATH